MINEFIQQYGLEIISTIVLAVVGYFGTQLKALYARHIANTEKEKVVKTVIKAVEQIYKDLNGQEKYEKAVENISAILEEKGICQCTELEIKMLIESAVKEMNVNFYGGAKHD